MKSHINSNLPFEKSNLFSQIKNILIIKPSSLGDIINTLPATDLIAKNFSDISFSWIVNPEFADILKYGTNIRKIILFKRKELGKPIKFPVEFIKLLNQLKSDKWEVAIDFQGLLRSSTIAKISNVKYVAGFASPKERISGLLYNIKIEIEDTYQHASEKNCALVNSLFDIKCDIKEHLESYILPVDKKYQRKALFKLKEYNLSSESIIIGVIPGARWETKQWPANFFSKIISTLLMLDGKIFIAIFGSKHDTVQAEKILHETNESKKQRIINFTGKTSLPELVELLRLCSCVITNDSGPMHIAAALHKKVFAMFGPTDPRKTGPYGKDNTIFQPSIPCIKCMKKNCEKYGKKCHTGVDPETVADIVYTYIKQHY